jgi:CDP-diacylglycerol--glycerol-3-phosphate 3-phosphatidyltransferase
VESGVTLTTANILTISRIFIAPLFLVLVLMDTVWGMHVAVVLYIVGAITDYLDGLVARRYGQMTELGTELDPLADKILTTMAWIAFFMLDIMPLWMVIVIVVRDFGTTVLRTYASSKGTPIVTSSLAKWKTFLQMLFIAYALAMVWLVRTRTIEAWVSQAHDLLYSDWTKRAIFLITAFTLYTAVEYIISNREVFRRNGHS